MKKFIIVLKTTITAVLAYSIVKQIMNRAQRPKRLFLYAVKDVFDFQPLSVAKVANITANYFELLNPLPFDDWDFVASAANGKNKWLYLRNNHFGAATGYIDANLKFVKKKVYPKNALGNANDFWSFFVVDGRGYILLIGTSSIDKGITVGFAQVLDDGSYVEWWRTTLDILFPVNVIGLVNAHLLHCFDPEPGKGSTTYIFDVKHAQVLSIRHWVNRWDGVVNEKNTLFFWDFLRTSLLCYIDDNYQIVPIRDYQNDPDLSPHFDSVASTPGAHLCWTYQGAGTAAVRVLDANGFKVTQVVNLGDSLKDFWIYIVPC